MPWYDYQCEKCGTVFEVNRSMNDESKAKCHACGSTRTIRIYSAAPVVFKGSGFYATDSGSRGSTTSTESSTTQAKTAPAADTAAPNAKPDAPVAAKPERKTA